MSTRVEIPDGSIHLSTKKPITVDVDNAITIGLNESIVLSQLRYWIEDTTSGKVVDGEKWVYNTYEGWRKSNFPFWSVATIRRVFSSLEDMELIKSRDDLNPKGSDRTKWYTVNFSHSAYGQGVSRPSAQNEQATCSKRAGHVLKKSSSSIAETTAETTAETSPGSDSDESSPTAPNENRHDSKIDDGEKPLKPIDLVMSLWEANGLGEKHPEEEANKGKNFSLAKAMIGEGVTPEEIAAMTKTFQKNREHMDVPPPFPMTMVYLWGKGGAVYKSWVADGRPGLEGKDSYVPKDPAERAERSRMAKEKYDQMARQQVEAMAGMANGEHR